MSKDRAGGDRDRAGDSRAVAKGLAALPLNPQPSRQRGEHLPESFLNWILPPSRLYLSGFTAES